jgi:hypothetical protein
MKFLPELVAKLTHAHDAWIVGSAANPDNKTPRDYDVQVPYSEWGKACMLIPKDAKRNSFGGFKCQCEGLEIDVWPGELGWIMQRPMCLWAWHPASGIRLNKIL